MSVPAITAVRSGRTTGGAPLLVLGPSLGTAAPLWSEASDLLGEDFALLSWDLPGHGRSRAATEPFSVADLADAVLQLVDDQGAPHGSTRFYYAGVSLGGAVGLELALRHPERLKAFSTICALARFGEPSGWFQRGELVRAQSTAALIVPSAGRWFGPDFIATNHRVSSALLHALSGADDESYALCCDALGGYDVRARLGSIDTPLLALAGEYDQVAPPDAVAAMAARTLAGRSVTVENAGHLAPAEQPARVAGLLSEFFTTGGK
ncbi:MAG: alpha/beta fold hydrolase [Microbacteriaceae bacterium]